jgi:N-formylglutamate deformylase
MRPVQPVIITPPTNPATAIPLVCDSPHSGTHYPEDFGHAVDRAALRRSEDTDIDALWAGVPAVRGTLVCATFPRSYIDPNRDEADIDLSMIDGPWPHAVRPSARCLELGNGLMWRNTPEHRAIYARRLSADEAARRIDMYWRPYRQALSTQLEEAAARHGGYWHLNLHSMPSNAYERLGLATTKPLADVVLGNRRGTTCDAAFTDLVAGAFKARGYSVAINDPYEGVEIVRLAGDPARHRHSLQIELNRALYMDEGTRERLPRFDALKADIDRVLAAVRAHVEQAAAALPAGHGSLTSAP